MKNAQQVRVLTRFLVSLEGLLRKDLNIRAVQMELATHVGVLEDKALYAEVDASANRMDEYIYLMGDEEGSAKARDDLASLIDSIRCSIDDLERSS